MRIRAVDDGPSSARTMTEECNPKILESLQQVFPDVAAYRTDASIVQANAVGHKLELLPTGQRVFYKTVDASVYVNTKKDWPDLRRTLLYARTEVRFYSQILPELQTRGFDAVPRVFFADCRLDGWVDESEGATQACSPEAARQNIKELPDPDSKGGVLILDCVSDDLYFQDSPLTLEQCHSCLETVAKLHASAWQDQVLLESAEKTLSKASFHLMTRTQRSWPALSMRGTGFLKPSKRHFNKTATSFGPSLCATWVVGR